MWHFFSYMKLVFENSGDCLEIEQKSVYEYFVQSLNEHKCNSFYCSSDTFDYIQQCSIELANNIKLVDNFLSSKLRIKTFTDFVGCNLQNQNNLNTIHELWVKLQVEHAGICNLMDKINLLDDFRAINNNVHKLESCWKFVYKNYDKHIWTVENTFGSEILDFNKNQISVVFHNLGRSSYNKWQIDDNNVHDIDTNDFRYLSGQLRIQLEQPQTLNAPQEYLDWCKKYKCKPIGSTLNLGNFRHDINELRTVFSKNESNKFFLTV